MALGGGTFLTNNKILPGSYINFISRLRSTIELSERGILAVPLALDWGEEDAVFEVSPDEFQKESLKLFGYSFDAPEMLPLREIFSTGVRLVKIFRLGGANVKARCILDNKPLATARFGGSRGNDLSLSVSKNVDETTLWDVKTYLGTELVDAQYELVDATQLKDNAFAIFDKNNQLSSGIFVNFTGGTSGTITGSSYQKALDFFEPEGFHALICPTEDSSTVKLFSQFTKRMRDDVGAKFVLAAYRAVNDFDSPDYEGVVSVENEVQSPLVGEFGLVYWVGASLAACAVNASLTNSKYTGELKFETNFKQRDLEKFVKQGKFVFHRVGDDFRVLEDINSFVSFTDTKGYVFQSNQTIRVCDQIANDIAAQFNTYYIGKVQNDELGRARFQSDVLMLIQKLEGLRAVQNFKADSIDISQGEKKDEVILYINELDIVGAMAKLYMTVVLV